MQKASGLLIVGLSFIFDKSYSKDLENYISLNEIREGFQLKSEDKVSQEIAFHERGAVFRFMLTKKRDSPNQKIEKQLFELFVTEKKDLNFKDSKEVISRINEINNQGIDKPLKEVEIFSKFAYSGGGYTLVFNQFDKLFFLTIKDGDSDEVCLHRARWIAEKILENL